MIFHCQFSQNPSDNVWSLFVRLFFMAYFCTFECRTVSRYRHFFQLFFFLVSEMKTWKVRASELTRHHLRKRDAAKKKKKKKKKKATHLYGNAPVLPWPSLRAAPGHSMGIAQYHSIESLFYLSFFAILLVSILYNYYLLLDIYQLKCYRY